ncbi:MAG: NFACT RNA binding domain-containing protein [Ignavibacteriales bacterium]|nr:NFACT RNA binding domain-containing protein [Ignavibacteriales bacterium]
MYKNYFFLNRLVIELNDLLKDFTLFECFSQEKETLVLRFNNILEEKSLLISVNQNQPCVLQKNEFHKARKNFINFFVEYLPSKINRIEIATDDRIIKISLSAGELYYFIRGKDTNILLVSSDGLIHTFKKTNSVFQKNIFNEFQIKKYTSEFNLPDLSSIDKQANFQKDILKQFPFISKEIINETKLRSDKANSNFFINLNEIIKEIRKERIVVLSDENLGRFILAPESFQIFSGSDRKYFDSVLEAVQYFISSKHKKNNIVDLQKLISKHLNLQLQKTSDKLNEIKFRLEQPSNERHYRNQANLLLTNITSLKKGMLEISLDDLYFNQGLIRIKLNESLSPKENINFYFEKAKNENENRKHISELFLELERKLIRLNTWKEIFISSTKIEDYKKIMSDLKINTNQKPFNKESQSRFKHYLIDGKYHLFVGKDSKTNDELTTKFAKQNDYWFHARSVSGSHVVLKVENTKEGIPKNILKKAASIAAYHSKAKSSKLVSVSYTFKKFVIKRKGMEPGSVNLLKEDVLLVPPEIPSNCEFLSDELNI